MEEILVSSLKGVGEKRAQIFNKMGIKNVQSLLYHFPFRYEDRRHVKPISQIKTGETGVFKAVVVSKRFKPLKGGQKKGLIVKAEDHHIEVEILFFSSAYVNQLIKENELYFFYGKVERKGFLYQVFHPDYALSSEGDFLCISPVYSVVQGLTQKQIKQTIKGALEQYMDHLQDPLPSVLREMFQLRELKESIRALHYPQNKEDYLSAKRRIVFDEFFELQMRLLLLKTEEAHLPVKAYGETMEVEKWFQSLPFQLTAAQIKVWQEMVLDFQSGFQMNRLIQGDVGSGKTILAFSAIYYTFIQGKQSVLMAPTSLLAEQHYESLKVSLGDRLRAALLVSKISAKEKNKIKEEIASGAIDVVIATHAVLQENVTFFNLGLFVTDEQHRFGIQQRLKGVSKGERPHALIMSATPIPRTLSLIVYGDMNVSVVDQLPEGRKSIKTHYVKTDKKDKMYDFIHENIEKGRQAYVVCPLVEDSENIDLKSAETHFLELQEKFPNFKIGLVHGKMKSKEKEEIMKAFKENRVHILVSTTVIEVGINVPNATIMVILHAERFGLAQLHQLRGRVGRGAEQSYCFLLSDKLGKVSKERIETMVTTTDGFKIAEKDLQLRGPGEVFGLRQHGLPELKMGDLSRDKKILKETQECVKIVNVEQGLGNPVFASLIESYREKNKKGFTL